MLGFYDYTVILTYISVCSSSFGMFCAINGKLFIAIFCLLFSGLCDMFDGKVARTKKDRTPQQQAFGIQLDSLSDVICFGAFPAVIGISIGMKNPLQLAVIFIFVLCAIIRLAYFNVTEEERQSKTKDKRKVYEGLPVTSVALIIPIIFCFRKLLGEYFALAYSILLLVIAIAFITRFRVLKPGKRGNILMLTLGALIFICLIIIRSISKS